LLVSQLPVYTPYDAVQQQQKEKEHVHVPLSGSQSVPAPSREELLTVEETREDDRTRMMMLTATRTVSSGGASSDHSSKQGLSTSGSGSGGIAQSLSTVSLSSNSSAGQQHSSTSTGSQGLLTSLTPVVGGLKKLQQILSGNRDEVPQSAISGLVIGRKKTARSSFSIINPKNSSKKKNTLDISSRAFSHVDTSDLEFADEFEADN
ncbi:hypothetical protein Ciccas_012006, partial [Cichlidogyrus casuarinus]